MGKYIFGIDLGTTNTCIAYVDESGRANVVHNLEGDSTTPSVVYFSDPGSVTVGRVAKETALVMEPSRTASLVKTLIGRTNFAISCDGYEYSPEAVSAEILRKIARDAAELTRTEVKDVVITCPAYFGTAEREATKAAGEIAGLNVMEIISEPTAAAMYYGCIKESGERTVLVYDLGGGTFDVTVMRIADGRIEEICKDGNHQLGGIHWDDALMLYLVGEFCAETGFDGELDDHAQQDLRLKAERAKEQLTSMEEVPVFLDVGGHRARINVSRALFDDITAGLLNESVEITDRVVALAQEKGSRIDEIILVGGSSRMPQVRQTLHSRYGLEPRLMDPDMAVAKGAAIYALGAYEKKADEWNRRIESGAADLTDEAVRREAEKYREAPAASTGQIPALGGRKADQIFEMVANKSYALKVRLDGRDICYNMILKNRKMTDNTVSVTRVFGTDEDNLITVELDVYESDILTEYFDVDEDLRLGNVSLEMPGDLPADSPVQVTFTLDQEGILRVTGRDLTTRREISAMMRAASGTTMSAADIAAAKARSGSIAVR